jgi:ABC-type dipeptide/oligopeptide/nickel transport system permease component
MKIFFPRFYNRLLFRRFIQSIILILLLIVIIFFLIHLAPGDPVYYLAGQSGDEAYYGEQKKAGEISVQKFSKENFA